MEFYDTYNGEIGVNAFFIRIPKNGKGTATVYWAYPMAKSDKNVCFNTDSINLSNDEIKSTYKKTGYPYVEVNLNNSNYFYRKLDAYNAQIIQNEIALFKNALNKKDNMRQPPLTTNAKARARLEAIKQASAQEIDEQQKKYLMAGEYQKEITSAQIQSANDAPLTFVELFTWNTWFFLNPEKQAGETKLVTSREFPVQVKGDKNTVIATLNKGIKAAKEKFQPSAPNSNDEDLLLLAQAQAAALKLKQKQFELEKSIT